MPKKKKYSFEKKTLTINEPIVLYKNKNFHIFNSFEEQENYKLEQMAKLSSEEILKQMRQLINLAYGMHGFDPNNLPKKHTIKIVSGSLLETL